jgi:hypothetical protein
MKKRILIITVALALVPLFSHSQKLNTDQEKGVFLSKCYALGIHLTVNDPEATQELKEGIKKWVQKIFVTSEKFISKDQFISLMKKEIAYLGATNDNGNYLRKQANQCTSILGGW